jgi:DNA-binding IclR family transcriptional regulator
MPDPSNPTSRVMDVLNFLAAHPTETFSLAEIARHLGLSNGSAHRLLTTLAAGQFLSRNERHRTYSLGIATVAIGQAAIEKHRGIEIARREVARLAAELDVQCSATVVVDDDVLVLVKEGTAHSHLGLTRVGERRPLIAPLGLCHVAWSSEAAIDTYVARVAPYLTPHVREHLQASFPLIRQRGFAIAGNGSGSARTRQTMVMPGGQQRDAAYWSRVFELVGQLSLNEVQLFDLDQARPLGISYMAAPVFTPDAAVAFQLVISGMPTDLEDSKISSHAERLCATAAAITDTICGRPPLL